MTEQAAIGEFDPRLTQTLTGVVQPPEPPQVFKKADPPRVELLREAAALITGDREKDYGPPSENFQRIADLWNVQFAEILAEGKKFEPYHAALALLQLKMARAVHTPTYDTFVDAAGYAAIAWEVNQASNE